MAPLSRTKRCSLGLFCTHVWIPIETLTKNGKPHLVPLFGSHVRRSPHCRGCMSHHCFRRAVMTGRCFSGFSKLKAKIDQLSNVNEWTLHKLKRSAATRVSRLGVAPHIVERILNHERQLSRSGARLQSFSLYA
jgi:hypothetical protein